VTGCPREDNEIAAAPNSAATIKHAATTPIRLMIA